MGNIEFFNQMASRYDTEERVKIAHIISDKIKSELKNSGEKEAIDYGSGTGLVGLGLAECFKSLLFMDASTEMVNILQNKLDLLGKLNLKALYADFLSDSFLCKTDVLILSQVLLHVSETSDLLKKCREALQPNGELIIVDFDKNEQISSDKVHNGFDQQELGELLEKIGFKVLKSETFYGGKNIFMNQNASLFFLHAKIN